MWTLTILYAAKNVHRTVVEMLFGITNVNIDSRDKQGYTALLYAVADGHETVVELLIGSPGVDINSKTNGGYTPLMMAAKGE
jgi:ankyrin repeat protein